MLASIADGDARAWVVRPAPEHEAAAAVESVAACLDAGRRALVIVPEAAPVPAHGDRDRRGVRRSRGDPARRVEAGAVPHLARRAGRALRRRRRHAPDRLRARCRELGLVVVSRESHPAHREDRAPYYHVRDVALARGHIERATVVLSAMAPSSEAAARSLPTVQPRRRSWVPVEIVAPGPEGRASRLVRALTTARRAFVYSPLPGYGVAAVCRACGHPAACAECGGTLRSSEGEVRCVVCSALGPMPVLRRERLRAASRRRRARGGVGRPRGRACPCAGSAPTTCLGSRTRGRCSSAAPTTSATSARAASTSSRSSTPIWPARRPGLTALERAVTTWTEAIAWARPGGRAIVQSAHPNDPAIQSLVHGRPGTIPSCGTRASRAGRVPGGLGRVQGRRQPRARRRAGRARPDHLARLVGRGADGMLARARPGGRARVRASRSSARRARRAHPCRSRTTSLARNGSASRDHAHPHPR